MITESSSSSEQINTIADKNRIGVKVRQKAITNEQVSFEFSEPLRLQKSTLKNFKTNISQVASFSFSQPVKLVLKHSTTKQIGQHKILVDQAPFSVFKSVKSQQQADNEQQKNNVVVINSIRNHPYNNSVRPVQDITDTTTTNTSQNKNETKSMNRNSSSIAILAQIKSLGPNFKSIFVRPKNSKHIDSSLILNKPKAQNQQMSSLNLKNFNSLFSSSTSNTSSSCLASKIEETIDNKFIQNKTLLTKILPNIEPKEIKLNQSVNDLLKKFASENDVLSKTIKNISKMSSTSSPAYSSTSSPCASPIPKHNNIALEKDFKKDNKWTCMVCLSKHKSLTDICSICGSSKPENLLPPKCTSIQFSQHRPTNEPVSFSSYLIGELNKKDSVQLATSVNINNNINLLNQNQKQDEFLTTTTTTTTTIPINKNPYLKKWTCIHCNYLNDSLKIVCLNCRWVKTSTTPAKLASKLNESIKSPSKEQLDKLIEQEKKQAEFESPAKRAKNEQEINVCTSCKGSIVNEKEPEKLIKESNKEETKEEAIKPLVNVVPNQNKWKCDTCLVQNVDTLDKCACCSTPRVLKPLNVLFKQSTNKWECKTCLAQNEENKLKCVCCQADKPGTQNDSGAIKDSSKSLSFSFAKPSTGSKWECKTCLVSNDSDKVKCVCCQSDKPGSETTEQSNKPKPLFLSSQPTLILPPSETSSASSIKFGLSSSTESNKPISFTSSNSSFLKQDSQLSGFKMSFGTSEATKSLFNLLSNGPSIQTKPVVEEKKQENEENKPNTGFNFSFKPLETSKKPEQEQEKPKENSSSLFNFTPMSPSTTITNNNKAISNIANTSFSSSTNTNSSTNILNNTNSSIPVLSFLKPTETTTITTTSNNAKTDSFFSTPLKFDSGPSPQNNTSNDTEKTPSFFPTPSLTQSNSNSQLKPFNLFAPTPEPSPAKTAESNAQKTPMFGSTFTNNVQTSNLFQLTSEKTSFFTKPTETSFSSANNINNNNTTPTTTTYNNNMNNNNNNLIGTNKNLNLGTSNNIPTSSSNNTINLFQSLNKPTETNSFQSTSFFTKPTETVFSNANNINNNNTNTTTNNNLFQSINKPTETNNFQSTSFFTKPTENSFSSANNINNTTITTTTNNNNNNLFQSKNKPTETNNFQSANNFASQTKPAQEMTGFQTPAFSSIPTFGSTMNTNTNTNNTTPSNSFFSNTNSNNTFTSPLFSSTSSSIPPKTVTPLNNNFSLLPTPPSSISTNSMFDSNKNFKPASGFPSNFTSFNPIATPAPPPITTTTITNNQPTSSTGFNFNHTPNFNFTSSNQNSTENNGMFQFSGNTDQSANNDLTGRKFRKAKRTR